ncbi:MAG TPA: sugar phosphorylase [Anaerolineae bacterium]|nr:sugar phosphorylase [Anaerolineae bacterium]
MSRIGELLGFLYGKTAANLLERRVREVMRQRAREIETVRLAHRPAPIDQTTALLITYADQVTAAGEPPLHTLANFLDTYARNIVSGVHILPFYPFSSDDGFSVMDYYAVNENFGTWADVERFQNHFELMVDGVINHASVQSAWFQKFLRGEPPYRDYFFVPPNDFDTSRVIRPRALPLLTTVQTAEGEKRVWTTFSADQADLNYKNSELLLQILDVLLFYVARGARWLRLDAIAFLWKESGTTCLHLPQTHAIIQLIRAILDEIAPHVILISETNVAHADNISYFGDGTNEAHWVYNFALPPLTLYTLQTGDANVLARWAQAFKTPSPQTSFFNFLASHDGIGLNPARGILDESEIDALVTRTLERNGLVGYKHNPDGSTSPYELNINYYDALAVPGEAEELSIARFLCSQAILLALRGVPGIYFHSLFGSRGDRAGADASGIPRRVNRQKFVRADLERELERTDSRRAQILSIYSKFLQARREHPVFHPNAAQTILDDDARVFSVLRWADLGSVWCVQNVTGQRVRTKIPSGVTIARNVLGDAPIKLISEECAIELEPYEVAWFATA